MSPLDQPAGAGAIGHSEAEGVADGHPSLHAVRNRPIDDHLDGEGAELIGFVQVNVDRLAVFLGQREHRVELPSRIAVDATGVEPANHVGAIGQRRLHQLQRAGPAHQTRLREGHDLDVDCVAILLARDCHSLESREPDVGVDVDMAANRGGALAERQRRQPGGLALRIDVPFTLQTTFGLDLVDQ